MRFGRLAKKPKSLTKQSTGRVEYVEGKYEGREKKEIAEAVIGKNLMVRKSQQGINWPILIWLPMLVLVPGVWLWMLVSTSRGQARANRVAQTAVAATFEVYGVGLPTATLWNVRIVPVVKGTVLPEETATYYPTYTKLPTYTVEASATPVMSLFLYSYYDPSLGGASCRLWDEDTKNCVSTMASGLEWREWYGKALACDSQYPFWTIFRVVKPVSIRGDYICLDRGGLIEGTRYLDFLDTFQRLPWNNEIEAVVIYP
jgi:hypothetical protein